MADYQKHTTHTDALDTLGSIIGPEEKRDAIHLAVFPVEAANRLWPGVHVKLDKGKAVIAPVNLGVGICDPFLDAPVEIGERFWLIVYPRQISSLRHVWEHPDFPSSGETEAENPLKESEEWLRSFLNRAAGPFYDDDEDNYYSIDSCLRQVVECALKSPELMFVGGITLQADIPPEFWLHVENYTGKKIPAGVRASFFRCSC